MVVEGRTLEELLEIVHLVLMHVLKKGIFAAAHECNVFTTSVTCAERNTPAMEWHISRSVLRGSSTRVGLSLGRRGGGIQFPQAVNWMRTSGPRLVTVVISLLELLETLLAAP